MIQYLKDYKCLSLQIDIFIIVSFYFCKDKRGVLVPYYLSKGVKRISYF